MSYATLMVHLDIDRPNAARLQIAGELAERFEARLIGICAADAQAALFQFRFRSRLAWSVVLAAEFCRYFENGVTKSSEARRTSRSGPDSN